MIELILSEGERHRRLSLLGPIVVVGRGEAADVRVASDRASRAHAQLELRADGVYLQDLGSSNGTSLNGVPVAGELRLSRGDRIQVGDAELTWLGGDFAEEEEPPPPEQPAPLAAAREALVSPGTEAQAEDAPPPQKRIDKRSTRWKLMNRAIAISILVVLNGGFALFWRFCVIDGGTDPQTQATELEGQRARRLEAQAAESWRLANERVSLMLARGDREMAYSVLREHLDRWPDAAASVPAQNLADQLRDGFKAEAASAARLIEQALDEGRTADAERIFAERRHLLRRWETDRAKEIESRLPKR